jgi:tetratricopeptide (TPR) repeat protein
MNLFEIDLDEIIYQPHYQYQGNKKFTDDELAELITQADCVIKDENEDPQKRADACVRKFQLLRMQYKLAPKLLEKALELYPDMPQALTDMGWYYLHIKDKEKALKYFDNVITRFPSYPYVWLEKAILEEDIEKRRDCYSIFIKLNPDSEVGYLERLWLNRDIIHDIRSFMNEFKKRRDIENAKTIVQQSISDYTELIRLDQSDYSYYEYRAELYFLIDKINATVDMANDSEESINPHAVNDIEQMLLLYPYHRGISCITTLHNMLVGFEDETLLKYYEKMISDLSPDTNAYWIAHAFFADAFEYINSEKSIQIYNKIINALKDGELLQLHCYHQRGWIYLRLKDHTKALADLAMIIRNSDPSLQDITDHTTDPYFARERRAKIYLELNDTENAINEYTAILTDPLFLQNQKRRITDTYIKRAKILMENKEYDRALDDYSSAIDSGIAGYDHTLKEAYAARIEMYKIRGEMDKAFAEFLKMSELKEESDWDDFGDDFLGSEYEIMDGI